MKKQFTARIKQKISQKAIVKNAPLKLVFIGLCILISVILVRNIFKLFSVQDRIDAIVLKIAAEKREKEELSRRLDDVNKTDFVEYEARDKLGWVKEGEVIVVLPPDDYLRGLVPEISDDKVALSPNWEKWLKLFFNDI